MPVEDGIDRVDDADPVGRVRLQVELADGRGREIGRIGAVSTQCQVVRRLDRVTVTRSPLERASRPRGTVMWTV